MEPILIIVHVVAAIGITGLVLLQQGKGADAGASFGGGASQTIFGSVGSGNALTRSTAWLAAVFFATSLTLAMLAREQSANAIQDDGLIQNTSVLNETPVVVPSPEVPAGNSDIPQVDETGAAETAAQPDLEIAPGDPENTPAN